MRSRHLALKLPVRNLPTCFIQFLFHFSNAETLHVSLAFDVGSTLYKTQIRVSYRDLFIIDGGDKTNTVLYAARDNKSFCTRKVFNALKCADNDTL